MDTSSNIIVICHNGNHYVFKHDGTEPIHVLNDRAWWIVKNLPYGNFPKLVNLSKVMANRMHFGVQYSDEITAEVQTMKGVYQ